MNESHDTPRLLTTSQLADRLGVSVRTLQRLLRQHDIRHDGVTRGQVRHKLYTAATLEYLRQQQADGATRQPETTTDSQPVVTTTGQDATSALLAVLAERVASLEADLADSRATVERERRIADDARANEQAAVAAAFERDKELTRLVDELAALRAVPRRPWWRWW